MSDEAMTNSQTELWVKIGLDMGMLVDELGHPYRQGQAYELDGEQYRKLHDFNPLRDPGDAFRVQLHFNLSVESEADVVIIRDGYGPILLIRSLDDLSPEGRVLGACAAIFEGAGRVLARKKYAELTGAG